MDLNNRLEENYKITTLDPNKDSFSYLGTLSAPSNFLYNFLLLMVMVVLALLPVVHADVTTSAITTVQSIKLKEKVAAPVQGKIVKLNIIDNQNIKKGDTLMVINDAPVKNELHLTQGRQSIIKESLHDIQLIISKLPEGSVSGLHTGQYQVEYQNYLDQKNQLQFKLDRATKSYERNKKLFDQKVITTDEFEQFQLQYNQAKSDIDLLNSKFKSKLEADRYQFNSEKSNLNIRETQLVDPIANSVVIANTMGVSFKTDGIQEGSFVQAGQEIAEIVPDTGLIAACLVLPKDIAYIKKGQPVKVQIDAFNYYEWGTLQGTVFEVYKDVNIINNQPYYIVRCKLNRNYLTLRNGYHGALINGMTGKTFFFLGRKSLWQLAFTKVSEWFSPRQN